MKALTTPLVTCLIVFTSCSNDPTIPQTCEGSFFGVPNESTGLSADVCSPRCKCDDSNFVAAAFSELDIDRLAATTLLDPPAVPDTDPYDANVPATVDAGSVCTVTPDSAPATYRVQTVSVELANPATITHFGSCGLCSSLQDLSVYMRYPDLTTPVRACSMLSLTGPDAETITCIEELGFTAPCAKIWFYNSRHTRYECLGECLAALEDPYQFPDGSLNACLACDEKKSGPTFKAVAGRTRRNTGLASAICRPCAEVAPLQHDYTAVVQ